MERFGTGEVSLVELTEAEGELDRREEAVLEGTLRLRLSWLELAFVVGWQLTAETPELASLQAQIARTGQSIERLGRLDLSPSVRAFANVADHSASLSYALNGEATAIVYTSDNEFLKGKREAFPVTRFLLQLTQHVPPRPSQYIRRYGLYAAPRKGKWPHMPHVMRLAPAGWKAERLQASESIQSCYEEAAVSDQESRSTCRRCPLG